jgi:hypothetical protein
MLPGPAKPRDYSHIRSHVPCFGSTRREAEGRSGFQLRPKRLWWRRFASGRVILSLEVKGLMKYRTFEGSCRLFEAPAPQAANSAQELQIEKRQENRQFASAHNFSKFVKGGAGMWIANFEKWALV